MNMHVVPQEGTPPAVEKKHRTITLTNRAPVRIVEDEWETVAEGKYYEEGQSGPEDFVLVEIRVRRHKPQPLLIDGRQYPTQGKGSIVHAKYELNIEDREWQRVRVGRLLTPHEGAWNLWKHIAEVGDELRARIRSDHCRKHVTHAVDECFASLAPQEP